MMPDRELHHEREPEDRPPFLSSWFRVYSFVIGFLSLLILLFYLFMKAYS